MTTDSLKLYLPFSGDALEYCGNSNDGMINGVTLTSDRFDYKNSAYLFDSTDSIEVKSIMDTKGMHFIQIIDE